MNYKLKYEVFDINKNSNKINLYGKEYIFSKKLNKDIIDKLKYLAKFNYIYCNFNDDETIYFINNIFKKLLSDYITPIEINYNQDFLLKIIIFNQNIRLSNWFSKEVNQFILKYKNNDFTNILIFIYKYLYKII